MAKRPRVEASFGMAEAIWAATKAHVSRRQAGAVGIYLRCRDLQRASTEQSGGGNVKTEDQATWSTDRASTSGARTVQTGRSVRDVSKNLSNRPTTAVVSIAGRELEWNLDS